MCMGVGVGVGVKESDEGILRSFDVCNFHSDVGIFHLFRRRS